MLSRWWWILACTPIVATGPASALGAIVDVDFWRLGNSAGDFVDGPGEAELIEDTEVLPLSLSRTIQLGASQSTSMYDFAVTASDARFHFDVGQTRDGDTQPAGKPDFSYAWGTVHFKLTQEASYAIEGAYELTGTPNAMVLSVHLIDASNQGVVLRSEQIDAGLTNQVFNVGGTAGSSYNIMEGALTGVLPPGPYILAYQFEIYAETPDTGASATGWLDFQIIPEPGVGVMAAAGAIVFLRRRI